MITLTAVTVDKVHVHNVAHHDSMYDELCVM